MGLRGENDRGLIEGLVVLLWISCCSSTIQLFFDTHPEIHPPAYILSVLLDDEEFYSSLLTSLYLPIKSGLTKST
jgi:hypothetical protein